MNAELRELLSDCRRFLREDAICNASELLAERIDAALQHFSAGGVSALATLLRRARPYVEAGSVAEDSLLEEIDSALSEKVTVFQTTEPHRACTSEPKA